MRERAPASTTPHSTRTRFVPAASDTTGPTIANVTFCDSRPRAYGDYQEKPDARYRAGETAWIYLDVGNLESRRRFDGGIENAIRQRLKLRDPHGTVQLDSVVVDEVLSIENEMDRDKIFLRNHFTIPAGAPAGEYRVELLVQDRFAGATTYADSSFTVAP